MKFQYRTLNEVGVALIESLNEDAVKLCSSLVLGTEHENAETTVMQLAGMVGSLYDSIMANQSTFCAMHDHIDVLESRVSELEKELLEAARCREC